MKKIILLLLIALTLSACKDSLDPQQTGDVRVEYSSCISCGDCTEDFECPKDAIMVDPNTGKAYIDADRCVQCMECIDDFDCETNAFVTSADNVAPAQIDDFTAISDSSGILKINFTAVGDDGTQGETHHYTLTLWDNNNVAIDTDFIAPTPQLTGNLENWVIYNLPYDTEITIKLDAFDEMGQYPETTTATLNIMGDMIDDLAPAQIDDLIAQNPTTDTVILSFTAVGDDANEGAASSYQIKYFTSDIDESNWDSALVFDNDLTPLESGSPELITINSLDSDTNYFFAVKALDEADNISVISNIANATTTATADLVAPGQISDLSVNAEFTTAELNWTATGDDDNIGTALAYELRVSTSEINSSNWDSAELMPNLPTPSDAGTSENFTATGLSTNTTYYFAIKAIDESNNFSELSNVVDATTMFDAIAPGTITNFTVVEGQANISGRMNIEWTAPGNNGDEGTADNYEIRYSTNEITAANWSSATLVDNIPAPEASGTTQDMNVTGLDDATIYYFSIKSFDATGNVSDISNCPAGKIVYQINESACRDCGNCINDCDYDAIYDAGPYKSIDPDLCEACGDCSCPWGLIHRWVVAY